MRFNRSVSSVVLVVVIAHAIAVVAMTRLSHTKSVVAEEKIMNAVVIPPPPPPVIEKPPEPKKEPPKPKPKKIPKPVEQPKPKELPKLPEPAQPSEQAINVPQGTGEPGPATDAEPEEPQVIPPSVDKSKKNKQPTYPRQSRRKGEEGTVLLEVLVLPNGEVDDVRIKKSSGFPKLDKAAVHAVKKWKDSPAKLGNDNIKYWHLQSVTFVMKK
jgi:protein TonB